MGHSFSKKMGIQDIRLEPQEMRLEEIVDESVQEELTSLQDAQTTDQSAERIATIDRRGSVTYGLIVGGTLDYFTGLGPIGIAISRFSATTMNYAVGGIYGKARELAYRLTGTTEQSSWLRRRAAELIPFNVLQPATTALAVAIGCLISEGSVDLEKVQEGALNMLFCSQVIAPAMGMYLDLFGRVFGVQSAARRAYKEEARE